MTLQLAAAAVKMSPCKLRENFQKPHVRKWIAEERRLQLGHVRRHLPPVRAVL
jgi:hypothetical protein